MLNSIQHLIISRTYEILKQVQDDKPGLFTRPSDLDLELIWDLEIGIWNFNLYALCPLLI
jgi:hypothetical protein